MVHTAFMTLFQAAGLGNKQYVFNSFTHILSYLHVITVQDTIVQNYPKAISMFLVSLILESDKRTVLVAMGHTSYWPLYLSIRNIHNNVCHEHHNGVVLLGFLAIPKSKSWLSLIFFTDPCCLADNKSCTDIKYWTFQCQLLHTSLQKILEPVKQYMTCPKVCCPGSHYHQAVFLLSPYIADYLEQCLLACIVQGWCPWYVYHHWYMVYICVTCSLF